MSALIEIGKNESEGAMAKDKEKPAADAAEGTPKKGKGKLLIIIVAAVVLLAGGGGAAWYFMHAKKDAHGGQEEAKHKTDPAKPPVFVKLETFTVNLVAEGEDHMLQTDIELKVAEAKTTDMIKARMPEIRNAILLLLSSKTAHALATTEGKLKLSGEIKAQINKALHVKEDEGVSGVFFTSFVIQ
ncbi:MAG: flagellar basal body-associated protein FliL [Sulfurimicrobium sp.]|nr:flagellar basal body-associated protein FliL [Sulfurimicrobium sp.]MDP1705360.1 flagellar basal body-associated protein FliL [Sulfurimicrobium sp.]MDP2199530.1 flagellar basal body-associated protein FliL [Sulfurimicrobium sp.]MDP3689210.1 flagellar basal body-associated protein FliL [Sulfurimicrobium sp.]